MNTSNPLFNNDNIESIDLKHICVCYSSSNGQNFWNEWNGLMLSSEELEYQKDIERECERELGIL